MSTTAVLSHDTRLEGEILAGFSGSIAPVPVSARYRAGLAVVAVAMLLLPLLYLALLAAALAGAWLYATRVWPLVGEISSWQLKMAVGGAPPLALLVVAFFLAKSIWPRRHQQPPHLVLAREDEPLLFAFVERLAREVGAPVPREIRVDLAVNASAGPRRGAWSLWRRDLVLTLGLPLAAGLPLQQMAGVLAHELGHFAQRHALFLTYLIRSINGWFHRVAEERDSLDAQLEQGKESGWFGKLLSHLSLYGLWTSRACLRGLMRLGHVIGSYQMRQMEFDADRYEARLAGTAAFEATTRSLQTLGAAYQMSFADLQNLWQEGRVVDLPELVVSHHLRLPAEVSAAVDEQLAAARTGPYDSHPSDSERIAHVRREPAEGIFRSALPATSLFRDFAALSRRASLGYYREIFGPHVEGADLVSAAAVMAWREREEELERAFEACFGDAAWSTLPLPFPPVPPAAESAAALRHDLRRLWQEAEALRLRTGPDLVRHREITGARITASIAEVLLATGFRIESGPALRLTDDAAALDEQRRLAAELAEIEAAAAPLGKVLAERLATALGGLALPEVAAAVSGGESLHSEVGPLYAALAALEPARAAGPELQRLLATLEQAWGVLDPHRENAILNMRIINLSHEALGHLRRLHAALEGIFHPFPHARGRLSLNEYALPELPGEDDFPALYRALATATGKLAGLRRRLLSTLAAAAARVEEGLG